MARVSALEVIHEHKRTTKRAREAKRAKEAQIKWNRKFGRKGLISSPPRLKLLDEKILSQMDAAKLLDCVVDQWQRGKNNLLSD
jgi:hypothetical protein